LKFAGAIFFLFLVVACGGCKEKTLASVVERPDTLLFTGQGAVVQMLLPSGESSTLVRLNDASVFDVSVSPDGKQLAFARAIAFQPGRTDFGTDIYVAGRDGSDPHMVATHSFPNELLRWPVWLAGSRSLLFQAQGVTAVNGIPESNIERLDLDSGARSLFVANSRLPATSIDGSTIAYFATDAGGQDTIWISDTSGGSRRPLLRSSSIVGSFGNAAPSPDGSLVVFGAAVPAARSSEWRPGARSVGLPILPLPSSMDGLPEDAWLIKSDGTGLRMLAPFAEDLPSFAWAGDGKSFFLLGATGLWRVDAVSGQKQRVGDGILHGQIAWGGPAP